LPYIQQKSKYIDACRYTLYVRAILRHACTYIYIYIYIHLARSYECHLLCKPMGVQSTGFTTAFNWSRTQRRRKHAQTAECDVRIGWRMGSRLGFGGCQSANRGLVQFYGLSCRYRHPMTSPIASTVWCTRGVKGCSQPLKPTWRVVGWMAAFGLWLRVRWSPWQHVEWDGVHSLKLWFVSLSLPCVSSAD